MTGGGKEFGIKELPAKFSGKVISVRSLHVDHDDPGRSLVKLMLVERVPNTYNYNHYSVPLPHTHRNPTDVIRLAESLYETCFDGEAKYEGCRLSVSLAAQEYSHQPEGKKYIYNEKFSAIIDLEKMVAVHEGK